MEAGSLLLEAIRKAAEEICERESCLLWDLEMTGAGKGRILRVTIEGKQGDVTIDDCENVSKALNLRLDVEDLVEGGPYQLEVSSPGIERKLKELWHFERVKGRPVEVLLNERVDVTKGDPLRIKGMVLGVEGENIIFSRQEGDELKVAFSNVKKAKTVFEDGKLKKRS